VMTTRKRERKRFRMYDEKPAFRIGRGETRRTLITTIWRFKIRYPKTFAMYKLHIELVAYSSIHAPNSAIVLGSYASA